MTFTDQPIEWILGMILVLSSIGVISARQPVHSCLAFLVVLLTLCAFYLQLSAQFIAVMQVLVYAGAILVLFMFVIVLFQDAYQEISKAKPQSWPFFLIISAAAFLGILIYLGTRLTQLPPSHKTLPEGFGTVQSLGSALYIDFFFPFEAVILIFLIAIIGALYIAKKER